jgi:hypothetical protein
VRSQTTTTNIGKHINPKCKPVGPAYQARSQMTTINVNKLFIVNNDITSATKAVNKPTTINLDADLFAPG